MQIKTAIQSVLAAAVLAGGVAIAQEEPAPSDPVAGADSRREGRQAARERFGNISDAERAQVREQRMQRRDERVEQRRERFEGLSEEERQTLRERRASGEFRGPRRPGRRMGPGGAGGPRGQGRPRGPGGPDEAPIA